jgi:hypothetical protein
MESISSLSELSGDRFALLQTDPQTGVPVNLSGEWIKSGEERYLVFDSESDARNYATKELKKNPLLEWGLFNSQGEQVDVLHDKDALINAARSTKPRSFLKKWFG